MRKGKTIGLVIPALNEEGAIGRVVSDIPAWVDDIVVVDNGSTDGTVDVARSAGARVVFESRRGYGSACLTGIDALGDVDVILFLDGDYSDHPDESDRVVDPILDGLADMVIGSRVRGGREPGALTIQARFGNRLSCLLIKMLWGHEYTDLGPFRAISMSAYKRLCMCDPNYGWTVEMQAKAGVQRLRVAEVPVSYRVRIGRSKVSGTIKGIVYAGTKILYSIFMIALRQKLFEKRRDRCAERLAVFTRFPEPGTTKTRLIPALGEDGAASLQRKMTEALLVQARRLSWHRPLPIQVRFEGGGTERVRDWLGHDLEYEPQGDGDIGRRMKRALLDSFSKGGKKVILVGSDIPGVTQAVLDRAFCILDKKDLVLGPAEDGGYYLIGANSGLSVEAISDLMSDVPWSTDRVLAVTIERARSLGLDLDFVDVLPDVDRPEDLHVWERVVNRKRDFTDSLVSVIIPTRDEESNITDAIRSASGENIEVIVVDGGSKDRTCERASATGAKIITTEPSRAGQMNAGADEVQGEVLLFLHADCRLPFGYDQVVRESLAMPRTLGGAFQLKIDSDRLSFRIIEGLANWRSKRFLMPYGDQAIFVRTDAFIEIGGFPAMDLMDDFELMRRLNRLGKLVIVDKKIITSARRWLKYGIIETTLINQAIIAMYLAGLPMKSSYYGYGRTKSPSVCEAGSLKGNKIK